MKAALFGATGLVGNEVCQQLLADPDCEQLRVFARKASDQSAEKLDWRQIDFDHLAEQADFNGIDTVFCCLGTTIKAAGSKAAFEKVDLDYVQAAAQAAKAAGIKQFLVISAAGVSPNSRVFYNRVKGHMEQAVRAQGFEQLEIIRPSLLLGARAEKRFGEDIGQAIMPLFSPLLAGPLKAYRPVQGRDVAAAMITLAKRAEPGAHVRHLPLGSP